MGLLYTLLIGLIVGAVAKLLVPGKAPVGAVILLLIYRAVVGRRGPPAP